MADSTRYASVTFRTGPVTDDVRKKLQQRVKLAAENIRTMIVRNISTPTRSAGPSQPGEFPHADTGLLRNSIYWRMVGDLEAAVGTSLNYGLWLEYGVAGEKTVVAAPGKVFAWTDKVTGEMVFRKKVTLKGMAARPFMRPTLLQMAAQLQEIMSGSGAGGEMEVNPGGG